MADKKIVAAQGPSVRTAVVGSSLRQRDVYRGFCRLMNLQNRLIPPSSVVS